MEIIKSPKIGIKLASLKQTLCICLGLGDVNTLILISLTLLKLRRNNTGNDFNVYSAME
jgi:hypothetical protein